MIATRVDDDLSRIEKAKQLAGRKDEILLLGVSKKVPLVVMQEAIAAGIFAFGESYIQEALPKIEQLGGQVRFDLIGPLQSNKVKQAVGKFFLIHAVDRISVAQEISKIANRQNLIQKILIQVNISKEATKSGIAVDQLSELCGKVLLLPNLALEGLMMIGTPADQGEDVQRKEFRKLRELKDGLQSEYSVTLPHLSMGMSDDFELAIVEGATIVRVGTGLFGERV